MFVWHVLCVVVFFVLEYITRWIVTRDTSAFTLEYFGVLKRTGFGDLEKKVLCTSMHGEVHLYTLGAISPVRWQCRRLLGISMGRL